MVELISAFLKEFFIPDLEDMKKIYNDLVKNIQSKFPFLDYTDKFINMFKGERFIEDINAGLSLPYIGTFDFKIIEAKYVNDGVQYFRSILRGWVVLMLLFYHLNELFTFIGQGRSTVSVSKPIEHHHIDH
ncbi:MAG: hypothetical protein WAT96_07360 [Streptococcus suis]